MSALQCGFIGLGNIGKPMCANIARKASSQHLVLSVFDLDPAPLAEMQALGARAAESAEELARNCSLIALCVRDDADVEQLLYGEAGIFAVAAPETVIAIHSTVTRDGVVRWAADAAERGLALVDAPITGGAAGAADATLCIMVGGSEAAVSRCQPMFACTSKTVVYAGEAGQATVLKLANNLMNYAAFSAISEAAQLVKCAGADLDALHQVGQANGVITAMMKQFIDGRDGVRAACSDEDMRAVFGPFAALAEKDLDHALSLAAQLNVALPLTERVRRDIDDVFMAISRSDVE
ncbi:MAG: NAD(P)-dependent oxidoreductase [Pseudomonadota bacterium]|nr:NAD(P)-dependent oxidoreductase [Pseudomonadota bacterium]